MEDDEIRATLAALAARRGIGKTFCPSEAARALAEDWRQLMADVRRVATEMQRQGVLQGFQKGRPVDLAESRGAVRLGLPDL